MEIVFLERDRPLSIMPVPASEYHRVCTLATTSWTFVVVNVLRSYTSHTALESKAAYHASLDTAATLTIAFLNHRVVAQGDRRSCISPYRAK